MGAKQSKRSVDISGKEAESAGEVAAAIAGGEGRVEQLADADALKPQLNGDAHIHETEEKQKDIDIGTPENEKDATTEKETKQLDEEKEAAPLTNGESEQKVENGESTPTPEDGKKPKKEKVKKKWSLRSISFSRKDKPKQEKKAKDEEPKTNGEPEKVPEETAEAAPEVPPVTETAEEAKTPSDVKEDKTPETPVTEPITNGSSTPESPKVVETPVVEEPAAQSPDTERPEAKAETEPEQLPLNGLSLEEPVKETIENEKHEDSKEEPTAETSEIVPEISVKKEVCVEQMSLIESTPPPLPANPPPSSVASFAATTMAPELTDASLANTADNAIPPPISDSIAKDKVNEIPLEPDNDLTVAQTVSNTLSLSVKELSEKPSVPLVENVQHEIKETIDNADSVGDIAPVNIQNVELESEILEKSVIETEKESEHAKPDILTPPSELEKEIVIEKELVSENSESEMPSPPSELDEGPTIEKELEKESVSDNSVSELPTAPAEVVEEPVIEHEIETNEAAVIIEPQTLDSSEEFSKEEDLPLPSPPPSIGAEAGDVITEINPDTEKEIKSESIIETSDALLNSNHISDTADTLLNEAELTNDNEDLEHNIKKKSKDILGNVVEAIECNGNIEEVKTISEKETVEIVAPSSPKEIASVESGRTVTTPDDSTSPAEDVESESFPPPPSELSHSESDSVTPQEPLPISDKLADLIADAPEVPELKTETETTSESAVAN